LNFLVCACSPALIHAALMNKFADLAAKLDALTARTAGAERAASLAIEKAAAAAGRGSPTGPSVVYVPQESAAAGACKV
jgi:hypothetical protein